jgi:hypothetical protein
MLSNKVAGLIVQTLVVLLHPGSVVASMPKLIVDPGWALASTIAWRKLPAPESSVLTTVNVFARATVVGSPHDKANSVATAVVNLALRDFEADLIITPPVRGARGYGERSRIAANESQLGVWTGCNNRRLEPRVMTAFGRISKEFIPAPLLANHLSARLQVRAVAWVPAVQSDRAPDCR